ncbi:MAG: hypothetical protein FWG89_07835 [Treponema sp.]|nr:hypothetical protein [Treponema sp.]
MKKITKIGVALLFAACALSALVTGCTNEPAEIRIINRGIEVNVTVHLEFGSYSTGPLQQGLTAGQWETLPDSAEEMPENFLPILPREFGSNNQIDNIPVNVHVITDGTVTIDYALSVDGSKPVDNWSTDNIFYLIHGQYIYLRVTVENVEEWLLTETYYRVLIHELEDDSTLVGIYITSLNDMDTGVQPTDSANSWIGVNPQRVILDFITESTAVEFEAIPKDFSSRVEYAYYRYRETGNPVFGSANTFNLENGDRVFVRVTPLNPDVPPRYYGIIADTPQRLSEVNISGNIITIEPLDYGRPSIDDHGPIKIGMVLQALTDEFSATVIPGVSVEYAMIPPSTNRITVFSELDDDTELKLEYPGVNQLFIKTIVEGFQDRYYRFELGMASTNCTVTGINFNGTPAEITAGTGSETDYVGAAARGTIALATSQARQGPVVVIFEENTANVTGWAIVEDTDGAVTYNNIVPPGKTFSTAAAITNGQNLALRVVAEYGNEYHYRLVATVRSNDAALVSVAVGGVTALRLGTPSVTAGNASTGAVGISPAVLSAGNIDLDITPIDNFSVQTFAVTATTSPPALSAYAPIATIPVLAAGNHIWIRSVSEDGSSTLFYRLVVEVRFNDPTIQALTIRSVSSDTLGVGRTTVELAAGNPGAITITAAQAASGAVITATPTSGGNGRVTGYAVAAASNHDPTFATPSAGGTYTTTAPITNGQHVFVRVVAENGTTILYYRVVVTVTP